VMRVLERVQSISVTPVLARVRAISVIPVLERVRAIAVIPVLERVRAISRFGAYAALAPGLLEEEDGEEEEQWARREAAGNASSSSAPAGPVFEASFDVEAARAQVAEAQRSVVQGSACLRRCFV
jgi:hypothetical protein